MTDRVAYLRFVFLYDAWDLDDIFTERLWRPLKHEEVYIHKYDSHLPGVLQRAASAQALEYRTPVEVYRKIACGRAALPGSPISTPLRG